MFSVDDIRGGRALHPEERLWAAVISRAVEDLTRERHRANALNWFRHDSEEPGTFRWTCHMVGLCPDIIRRRAGVY